MTGKVHYQVITRVPDPDEDPTATGNLYDEVPLYRIEGTGEMIGDEWTPDRVERRYGSGSVLMPVFELGEIIIVNESGREAIGRGRKADKWDVSYEEFTDIEQAIARAREVIEQIGQE